MFQKILSQAHRPPVQAVLVFALSCVLIVGGKLVMWAGVTADAPTYPWLITCGMALFFAVFNSIGLLNSPKTGIYFRDSIYSYVAFVLCSGLLAWGVSGLKVNEAGTFRWIYIVVTIGYLVFLSIVQSMRRVMDFAQQEDKRWENK